MASKKASGTSLAPSTVERGQSRALIMDAPAPGSYWRLREAFEGRHDDRCQANSMAQDTVLMLESIEYADGSPHAYVFSPHPGLESSYQIRSVFHADDFYLFWSPAPDGESVRARELKTLLTEMDETKSLMLSPPPEVAPDGLLEHDPLVAATPGADQTIATIDSIVSMTRHAERLKEDAKTRSDWISTHSETLAKQGQSLAFFHQERAEAALARAKSQLDGVEALLKTVENLRLYTGEGVTLFQLRDGAPAAPEARLTIYQELLALDEETLLHLDSGGLDHTQVESLIEALDDPALLDRMIPSPRGMVLCRFRSNFKEFTSEKGIAGAMVNSAMNEASQQVMLLIRDGQRLWLLQIEGVLKAMTQLLPSSAEQSAYFTRRGYGETSQRITKDDLDYAKAQRKQIGRLDQYGKVLITLWGLHDRVGLFADSAIPRMGNWLDPAFQNAHLALVSMDAMMAVQRPSFDVWQSRHNAYLCSGAWVAANLTSASETSLPAAYASLPEYLPGRGMSYTRTYDIDLPVDSGPVLIDRVRSDKKGLYILAPLVHRGYGDTKRRINGKYYVKLHHKAEVGRGVLVLDRVRSSELDYYLTSRQQRREYGQYIPLFRAARHWTAQRDEQEAGLRAALREAVNAAQLAHDPATLDDLITDALAVARTARRSRQLPAPQDAGFKVFLRDALSTLHALLTNNSGRVAQVEHWARTHNRTPLRLALTGKDVWHLYLTPIAQEHDVRLGAPVHVTMAQVRFTDDGADVQLGDRVLLRAVAGEQVIHDWNREVPIAPAAVGPFELPREPKTRFEGASEWIEKRFPYPITYAQAIAAVDLPAKGSAEFDPGDLLELVLTSRRYMRQHSKGSVERKILLVPVGSALSNGLPVVLVGWMDALGYAHLHGGAEVKAAAVEVIESVYKYPDSHVKGLKSGHSWALQSVRLDHMHQHRNDHESMRVYGRFDQSDCRRPGDGESKTGRNARSVQVMTVTPLGVALFPWLARVTEAATG